MRFQLKKGSGIAVVVTKGNTITISCRHHGQLSDLVFLNYSQGITLDRLRRFVLKPGDELFDSNEEPVLRVLTIDSDAQTNILYPGCRRKIYREDFGKEKDGCRDILASALGISPCDLPSTINLFMDFELDSTTYSFRTSLSRSKENDSVSFLALKNCTVAVSACPCESDSCGTEGEIEVWIGNAT
jgi:uncharacterized protein YcgI (DUF1989 family)